MESSPRSIFLGGWSRRPVHVTPTFLAILFQAPSVLIEVGKEVGILIRIKIRLDDLRTRFCV
jgi:hypothetical protein